MPKYKQLSIDGVIGDIWDDAAIHEEDLENVVLSILDSAAVRTKLLNIYHPIGSYYFTNNDVNPGTFLGGTWASIEGKFLIGASDVYEVNSEGGTPDAIIPEHSHTASGIALDNGAHTHTISGSAANNGNHIHYSNDPTYIWLTYKGSRSAEKIGSISGSGHTIPQLAEGGDWQGRYTTNTAGLHGHTVTGSAGSNGTHRHNVTVTVNNSGESGVGKNLPPYKAAYIWVRTA